VVNNQILDWSFKLDGMFLNASQAQVYDTVASDIVSSALNGYNGKKTNTIIPNSK
jgi:kinesin family protein 6/9